MSEKIVQIGPQYRGAEITKVRKAEEAEGEHKPLEIEFTFSSEQPVERGWWERYQEILDHSSETSIRLDRLKSGTAPLLFNHDFDQHIGIVESVKLADRKLTAKVRFGTNDLAKAKQKDIEDGILKNVSFMYAVHSLKLDKDGKGKEMDVYRSFDWEPYEVSFVTVPADHTVGLGRAASARHADLSFSCRIDGKEIPTNNQAARSAASNGGHMPEQNPAELSAEQKAAEKRAAELENELKNSKDAHARYVKYTGIARAQGCLEIGVKAAEEGWDDAKFMNEVSAHLRKQGQTVDTTVENYLDMPEKEKQRYSLVKLIRALRSGKEEEAGLELEAHKQIAKRWNKDVDNFATRAAFIPFDVQARMLQKRDLTAGSQSGGGFTIQNEYGSLIELLRNNAEVIKYVTFLSGLVGDLKIARQTGAGTAYWIGEGANPTESQQSFGMITMTPKKLGAFTDITDELLTQSSIDVEQFVINDLARVMALAMDTAIINGAGANGEPLGILNTSGIGSVTTGGGLTWAEAVEFETDVTNSNYPTANCRYITNGTIRGTAKTTLRDAVAGADYVWTGDNTINGYPSIASTNMPSQTMIYGDYSQYLVGKWGDLQIGVDLSANFLSGGVRVRLLDKMDGAVRHVGAFSAATDI